MSWKFCANRRADCQPLAAAAGLKDSLVGSDWGTVEGIDGKTVAFGRFVPGRYLMNEQLVAAALLRLYPADPAAPALELPGDFVDGLAAQAPDATLLFIDGPTLHHGALAKLGAGRWFTHTGQAILRRDQLAMAMEMRLSEEPPLAKLSNTWPTAEDLDRLYTNYCALTGLLPRHKRSLDWWKELLKRTDIRLQAIDLPTYDEEDPEELTGPSVTSGYVIYRDEGDTRVFLETVVSLIDGDEDENIDLLLNDSLHALVREAFWPAARGGEKAGAKINRLIWHGSPGDLLWSRTSMYGCETREQTGTSYVKVLKPAEIAEQLIRPMVEQDSVGDFEGELTVVLSDLQKFAFRRKGNRKAGRLTVTLSTQEFISCMLHPYRLTSLVAEQGIEFDCDNEEVDPMWVVFTSLFDVLHPHWPVLE